MNKPTGIEPPPEASDLPPALDGLPRSGDGTRPAFVTRRRLLLVAGGSAAGAVLFRHWAAGSAPETPAPAPHQLAQATDLPRPMEEAPLPRDVHVSVVQAGAPAATQNAPPPSPANHRPVQQGPGPGPKPGAQPVTAAKPAPTLPVAPAQPKNTQAAWLRNARPFVDTGNVPAVAIVVDDLGLSEVHTHRAMALPGTVTTAIMTYATRPEEWVGRARAAGHEILVHVPMQPINPRIDPGPRALTVSLSDAEILDRLRWGLARLDGYVGINNHMGSRFTQDRPGMDVVMAEVKSRGLLFLDSVTIGRTMGAATALPLHVPFAERNVFLDDEPTVPYVSHQLAVLERFARRHGSAIAIGHPHPATLAVLAEWVPSAAARGIGVVPLTSVMRRSAMRA